MAVSEKSIVEKYERKMRDIINKKLRTWEQFERPLLQAHGFLAATISSSGVTTYSSSGSHYPDGSTVRSSIADARVAPNEPKSTQIYREEYEKEEGCSGRDLNPGSATRKAAMLDRTVQLYREETVTTPPEHSQTV